MSSQEQFEQAYAEDNDRDIEWCRDQRMPGGSYLNWHMSRAWHWWQRGKEAV